MLIHIIFKIPQLQAQNKKSSRLYFQLGVNRLLVQQQSAMILLSHSMLTESGVMPVLPESAYCRGLLFISLLHRHKKLIRPPSFVQKREQPALLPKAYEL